MPALWQYLYPYTTSLPMFADRRYAACRRARMLFAPPGPTIVRCLWSLPYMCLTNETPDGDVPVRVDAASCDFARHLTVELDI